MSSAADQSRQINVKGRGKMCWIFHDWDAWGEVKEELVVDESWTHIKYMRRYQRRECTDCGKIEGREVGKRVRVE